VDEDLHREILEEHGRRSHHKYELPEAELIGEYRSELTGNESKLFLKLSTDGTVSDASFMGQGSALSLASGSLIASYAPGKTTKELLKLCRTVSRVILEGADEDLPGELVVYHTIRRFPERHDCALLAWRALEGALGEA
jgi:nitrogen fixation NifU-like protein